MLRVLSLVVTIATGCAAQAGEAPGPDAAQLRAAREASRSAVEAARALPQPDDQTPAAAMTPGVAPGETPPTLVLPETDRRARATADIRDLLQRARAGALFDHGQASSGTGLRPLIFVSLSMPETALRALLAQAANVDAALVLRGLVEDSLKRTVERIGALLGVDADATDGRHPRAAPSLMIDPTLFERFDVRAVPTFVVPVAAVAPCTRDACPTPPHVKVAGDVSLVHALRVVAREADDPRARAAADGWVRRLEDRE